MSTVDLIYKKAKTFPGKLQSEALGFVEYLGRRRAAEAEADGWQRLSRATQALAAAQRLTDEDIAAEIAGLPRWQMRVVVDTNVVVSAILRDRLPEKI